MIRLLALIFCFPVAVFAQWVPYATNPIISTSITAPSGYNLYLDTFNSSYGLQIGTTNAGSVTIGNGSPGVITTQGIAEITNNASGVPAFTSGTVLGVVGKDSTVARIQLYNYYTNSANPSLVEIYHSGGTLASPLPPAGATQLAQFAAGGYNTSAYVLGGSVRIGTATNTWSTTDHGSKITFYTTPDASTTQTLALTIDQNQLVTAAAGLVVTGTVSATSKIYPDTGDTPTIASGACGTTTNGTIAGNDQTGVITIGAAATTTCTISFGATWSTAPKACLFSPNNAAAAAVTVLPYSTITNASTWVLHGAVLASTTWNYHCF